MSGPAGCSTPRSPQPELSGVPRCLKLDLAKEAVQLAVEILDERNEVGVIAFDTARDWLAPMGPAKDKDQIIKAIATIGAGGGTDLFPPMKDAYEVVYDRKALLRHVIVLSDGEVQSADLAGLVRRMQQDKITVSAAASSEQANAPGEKLWWQRLSLAVGAQFPLTSAREFEWALTSALKLDF